mmetsp:Transcript_7822/g.11247  ORF Transcript_7822/g.11247 Transcript_7822/m.11247 type:complete len:83 (-) Transcript_7822:1708-1956(-)
MYMGKYCDKDISNNSVSRDFSQILQLENTFPMRDSSNKQDHLDCGIPKILSLYRGASSFYVRRTLLYSLSVSDSRSQKTGRT